MLSLHASNSLVNPTFCLSTQTLAVQSDLIGYPDLKFQFDIYVREGSQSTESLVYSVEHYPTPNGIGILRPHEVLRSYLSNLPTPFIITGVTQNTSTLEYSIVVSELSPLAVSNGITLTPVKFIDGYKAINAIQSYTKDFSEALYLLKSVVTPLKKFTTPIEKNYFDLDEYGTLSIPVEEELTGDYKLRIYTFENSLATPTIYDFDLDDIGNFDTFKYNVPVGPKNLLGMESTIFDDDIEYYIAVLVLNTTILTVPYYVYLKTNKKSCYKPKQFVYMNEFGDFDYITFTGKYKENFELKGDMWVEYIPNQYTLGQRGEHSIHSTMVKGFTMNTGLLNVTENDHFNKMLMSPSVYEISGTNILPLNILTTKVVMLSSRNRDKIYNYDVSFKYAYNTHKQNG